MDRMNRRDLMRLTGGAVWVSLAAACGGSSRQQPMSAGPMGATPTPPTGGEGAGFLFFQITDTHHGYQGPNNPNPRGAFERSVAEVKAWPTPPAFVIHTGDITHLTADAVQRKDRMVEAKAILAGLGVEKQLFIPGEHDAKDDRGAAFQEVFGAMHHAFEHQGVYFIALDNGSDPKGALGDEQLTWLEKEVDKVPAKAQLVVFAHRPLFPLAQAWDWFTADGDRALAALERHPGSTVFYGHIHQSIARRTGTTTHIATRSLVFPLPVPGSQPNKAPAPWDPEAVDHGLGYRGVALAAGQPPTWVERALVG
jgi:3',5'-cyclic AMP phosphodiesterase CpdA